MKTLTAVACTFKRKEDSPTESGLMILVNGTEETIIDFDGKPVGIDVKNNLHEIWNFDLYPTSGCMHVHKVETTDDYRFVFEESDT